jgi:hypothetical protein
LLDGAHRVRAIMPLAEGAAAKTSKALPLLLHHRRVAGHWGAVRRVRVHWPDLDRVLLAQR